LHGAGHAEIFAASRENESTRCGLSRVDKRGTGWAVISSPSGEHFSTLYHAHTCIENKGENKTRSQISIQETEDLESYLLYLSGNQDI